MNVNVGYSAGLLRWCWSRTATNRGTNKVYFVTLKGTRVNEVDTARTRQIVNCLFPYSRFAKRPGRCRNAKCHWVLGKQFWNSISAQRKFGILRCVDVGIRSSYAKCE